MSVTDCSIGTTNLTPDTARDEMVANGAATGAHQLRVLAGLCNAAEFDVASMHLPLHERNIHGDATDQAILRLSEHLGSLAALRQVWKRVYELAFNSKNKFMIRVFSLAAPEGVMVALSDAEQRQFKQEDT